MTQSSPVPENTSKDTSGQALDQNHSTYNLPGAQTSRPFSKIWRVVHWLIILHFLGEILYCGHLIFSVLQPEGHSGPLMGQATQIPFELMVTRRLYAIECWVATAGLAIYLAITEFAPRIRTLK